MIITYHSSQSGSNVHACDTPPMLSLKSAAIRRVLTLDRVLFVGLLLAVVLTFPPLAANAGWQQSFATYVHAIVLEAFPYLLLGSLLAGLIELLLPADFLPRFARRMGPLGMPATIALAPLTPVCECGVVPIARSLLAKGLPLPHTVAYLLAAPIMNPTVVLTTWLAFQDWRYPVLRILGAVVVACAVGSVVARLGAPRVLLAGLMPEPVMPTFGGVLKGALSSGRGVPIRNGTHAVRMASTRTSRGSFRTRAGALATQVLDHFLDMAGYFLVGVFIAAAMKTFLGTHLDALGTGTFSGPLTMMATAFVLSLCAEADAFVAAGFTEFSLPAKIAFLVFGPMFDIKLLLMYHQVFRGRFIVLLTLILIVLIQLYALAIGLLVGVPGAQP